MQKKRNSKKQTTRKQKFRADDFYYKSVSGTLKAPKLVAQTRSNCDHANGQKSNVAQRSSTVAAAIACTTNNEVARGAYWRLGCSASTNQEVYLNALRCTGNQSHWS